MKSKNLKKDLRFILVICLLIVGFYCLQGVFVNKEIMVESSDYIFEPSDSNFLFEIYNLLRTQTPMVIVISYILIQFVLLIIAIKKKKFKQWLKIIIIIFIGKKIVDYIFLNFIIDQSNQMNYITNYLFTYENYEVAGMVNLVIDIIALLSGVIFNIMLVSKFKREELEPKLNDKLSIIMYILIISFSLLIIFSNLGTRMYVHESDWSFGKTNNTRYYSKKIDNIEDKYSFIIIDVDKDGVLIEYKKKKYNQTSALSNTTSETIVVQQKLVWNTWYRYSPPHNPWISTDGGTKYSIKFKK